MTPVLVALVLAVSASPALAASEAGADASPAPSAAPSPAPDAAASPGPAADRAPAEQRKPAAAALPGAAPKFGGLLGDFGHGTRSSLAAEGLTINGHLVSESSANLSGGFALGGTAHQRATGLSSEFGFGFDLDFNKLAAGSGAGILHFLLTTRFGSNLSSEAIGSESSVEEIYGDGQTTRITFLDYEQPFGKKRFDLRFGKYNQQNDFIAGSSYWGGNLYCFYQNNGICGTPSGIPINNGVVPGGSEGYTYYPSSEWGARLKANLSRDLYVQVAAIQGNPLVNNPDGGLYLGFNGATGTELPLEIGLTLRDRDGDPNGNLRFGGYYNTSNVQDFASRARGSLTLAPNETNPAGLASNAAAIATILTRYVRGSSGAYVQADHVVEGSADAGKTGTAFFAAFEYSDPQTSALSTMFDVGVVRHGTFPGRKNDTIAAGFASDDYNVRLQQLETALQARGFVVPNTVADQALELTYGLAVNSWFILRPGAQLIVHPDGVIPSSVGARNPPGNAFVIDLGGYLTF